MIPKPNLFVIGASKSGTCSLCDLLNDHPDVFFSTPKELHYFSQGARRGLTREWYESIFREASGHRVIGEGSTDYSVTGLYPGVAERLAGFAPEGRLIYIVRDPFERIPSQWIQLRSMSAAPAHFPTAVREVPEMIEGNLYWRNISEYRRVFPDEQILVLFFDDFKTDPAAVVARCFDFLGLDPNVDLDHPERVRNARRIKRSDRPLLQALRKIPGYEQLRGVLAPESVRPLLKKLLTDQVPQDPEWDRETLAWVVDRLSDDVRRFLRHYGKPEDYWDLDPRRADKAAERPRPRASAP